MKLNRLMLTALLPVLLVACGGGSGDDEEFTVSVPYGMVYTVNGVRDATAVEVTQYTATTSTNGYSENCDIANYDSIASQITEYCDDERQMAPVVFQFRFVNNTLEPMPFSYTGVGITLQIEQRTGTDPETWQVVWDSDAYLDSQFQRAGLEYDQTALGAVTRIGPAETYPHQDYSAISFAFLVDRNFTDDGSGQYEQGVDSLVQNPSAYCSWKPVYDSTAGTYDKLLCQTTPLPAGTYRANIHYNFVFDGVLEDPEPVIITVNPEPST